jgi:sugar phosphate isomerase/epimerase
MGARPAAARETSPRATAGDAGARSLLPPERIGLQLYSVRNAISSDGFDKVFGTLAEIGFKQVEFAGYTDNSSPALTVKQLRGLLDKHGLKAAGSHVSATDDASMTKILDDAVVLGIPQVGNSLVLPSGAPTVDGWKGAAATANHYGELAAKRGMTYYLHNHFQEWAPCVDSPMQRGHDVLLAECDPRYVSLELDIFWCYVGAAQNNMAFDPLKDYAIPHRDRYKLFHVKDGVYDEKPAGTITDVGEGKIDFQMFFTELFKQSADEPSKHLYLWENDNGGDHPRGALASARTSYVNMRYALVAPAAAVTDPGGTPDCPGPAATVAASVVRTTFRRTKAGRRVLRITLDVDEPITVAARLTRGGKTVARATRKLKKGIRTVNLGVPQAAPAGAVRLALTLTDTGGTTRTVQRALSLPSRGRKA